MKSNQPKQQHIIPRTYLSQFQIEDVNGSFIFCINKADKYRQNIQRLGLNHAVFKKTKYYHYKDLVDPYSIEKLLSETESEYYGIIKAVKDEQSIDKKIIGQIIIWIFISRMRSPIIRYDIENKLLFLGSFGKLSDSKHIEELAKEEHLSIFFDSKKFRSIIWPFIGRINAMQWKILVAPDNHSFVGCDNPGFLLKINPQIENVIFYRQFIEVDEDYIIYYILSHRYCLEIDRFEKGTPLDKDALSTNIDFEKIDTDFVDIINKGTFLTACNIVFGNNQEQLQFTGELAKRDSI